MDPREVFGQAARSAPDPQVAPTSPEGTPPAAPQPPAETVTIPGGPGAPAQTPQQMHRVKVAGEYIEMPYEELLDKAAGGVHFTRQQQELAPVKELYDWLSGTPGAPEALAYLITNGVPQPGGPQVPQQAQQPGALGGQPPMEQGYPQPFSDPATRVLAEEIAEMKYQNEVANFQSAHPDADTKAVETYLLDNNLPTLEVAYRVMTYPDQQKAAALAQQQNAHQRQLTAIEPGAQGAPSQIQVNPHALTPDDRAKLSHNYNFLME